MMPFSPYYNHVIVCNYGKWNCNVEVRICGTLIENFSVLEFERGTLWVYMKNRQNI